ncbi:MAG: chemotaxis protein CheW [Deltaproteobacteria bacterium]|nr:chemotaxis protein CheW [Deltaproteobacteria bacterium]
MSTSDAWLLECGESLSIAVGDHQMVELLQAARCHHVPGSPNYCSQVLLRDEEIVPVMDIGALHHGAVAEASGSYLCLLHYQEVPNAPLRQLAVKVRRAPERIQVDDAQLCDLPSDFDNSLLKPLALSCFTHHAKPVLIIDIANLCSAGFRDLAAAS